MIKRCVFLTRVKMTQHIHNVKMTVPACHYNILIGCRGTPYMTSCPSGIPPPALSTDYVNMTVGDSLIDIVTGYDDLSRFPYCAHPSPQ